MAHAVLDRCMSDNVTDSEENPDIMNSKDYEVTFDFEFLEDWRPHESVDSNTTRCNTRGHNVPQDFTRTTSLEAADSVVSSHQSAEDDKKHSTKWKVNGFSQRYHPLNRMVSLLYNMHSIWWYWSHYCNVFSQQLAL